MPRKRATGSLRHPTALIWGFLAPAVLLFLVFFLYPLFRVIWMSFYTGSVTSEKFQYAGLSNYEKLLHDHVFWLTVWHNAAFVVVGGGAAVVLALATAVALTKIRRGRSFFRVVFLFPNVMSVVAAAILWSFMFNPSFGLVNAGLRLVGLDSLRHAWLGEPYTALPAVIFIHIWMITGFYVVLFYAGLLRIPADYSEAARIDGAGPFQEFRHITLPLLVEILKIGIVYVIINCINVFALVYVINEGKPGRYNDVLMTYMYEQAFTNSNAYGYACAIGVATLVMVLLLAGIVGLLFPRETIEL